MKINRVFPQPPLWAPRVTAVLLILNVVLAMAQAESAAAPETRMWDYTALAEVPAKARAKRNPLVGDPDAVTAGKKLFEQHCSDCHGIDARGGKRGPSLHVVAVQEAPPGAIFDVLTNGVIRPGMPGWSKLPEPERWQIVSFLKSLHE
jgi:mono/diheme cytochrome c family protein